MDRGGATAHGTGDGLEGRGGMDGDRTSEGGESKKRRPDWGRLFNDIEVAFFTS